MRNVLASAVGVLVIGLMAAFATLSGLRAPANPGAKELVWTEVKWPFPLDQWGIGKAFVCIPADCGVKVDLYIRPKIGYCNCATGISDDAELERVGDTELVSPKTPARGRSNPIKVGWMEGRSRPYWAPDGQTGVGLLSSRSTTNAMWWSRSRLSAMAIRRRLNAPSPASSRALRWYSGQKRNLASNLCVAIGDELKFA